VAQDKPQVSFGGHDIFGIIRNGPRKQCMPGNEEKIVHKKEKEATLGIKENQCRVKARNSWIEDQSAQGVNMWKN
jgi:hypothetical protein